MNFVELLRKSGSGFLSQSLDIGYVACGVLLLVWEDVSNVRGEVYRKGVGFILGGEVCVFWFNSWVGVGLLCSLS